MATTAHTNKGIVLILACAAQFMVVLDVAIVNVALPSIQQELGIGQATSQWIVIAYGLMLGGFLLLGGRLADSRPSTPLGLALVLPRPGFRAAGTSRSVRAGRSR